jgi:cell division protein FtsB
VIEVANNRAEVKNGREILGAMLQEEQVLALENEQFESYAKGENFDEFIERYARDDMGYADPQERIFHIR